MVAVLVARATRAVGPSGLRRGGARPEAGVAETVLIVPVLLTLFLLVVQVGLYFHANQIAIAATQDAAAHAALVDVTNAEGAAVGNALLEDQAPTLIDTTGVRVHTGTRDGNPDPFGTFVIAEVTGDVPTLVPFLTLTVHARDVVSTERFIPQPSR